MQVKMKNLSLGIGDYRILNFPVHLIGANKISFIWIYILASADLVSVSSLCPSALVAKPLEHQIPLRQLPKITLGGIHLQTSFYVVCTCGLLSASNDQYFYDP